MSLDIAAYLNVKVCTNPAWSPDGQRLAFLSNLAGLPQAYLLDAAGGWPHRLTFTPHAVRQVAWRPAGTELLYVMDCDGNERHQFYLCAPDGSQSRALTALPEVVHNAGHFSPDGRWFSCSANCRDPRWFDLLLLDVASGERRRLISGEAAHFAGRFSPDGQHLLASRAWGSFHRELLLIDLASGAVRQLSPPGTDWWGPAQFSADGQSVLVLTDYRREYVHLVRLPLDGGPPEPVVTAAWDVDGFEQLPGRLAYTLNVGGASELHLRSGQFDSVVDLPLGTVSGLEARADGSALVLTLDQPTAPSDLWVIEPGQRPRQVTHADRAGLPAAAFSAPREVRYPTFDGRAVPAWLYGERPGPQPAVMVIHGGPEGQTRAGFNPLIQFLANRGYLVLAPNVRGSTGYGKTWHHLDDVRLRLDSVRDAAAAVDWLVADVAADPARIACYGGSYGGFMVLSLVTRYPELWAAGVDVVGIANFVTFLERTGPYRRKLRESEYGSLEHDADFLREISPVHYVDQVRCPLFVVQGAQDPRVPQHESDQMVAQLRARGLDCEYLVYPDEGHGLVKLSNRLIAYQAIADFLDQHLRPAAATPDGAA
ncbi:MAG: S9 family peptidase [Fimbriimonadaceae bacterium]|nr:S9 family peptidase [Fimbriimonadaceae bacterium]